MLLAWPTCFASWTELGRWQTETFGQKQRIGVPGRKYFAKLLGKKYIRKKIQEVSLEEMENKRAGKWKSALKLIGKKKI